MGLNENDFVRIDGLLAASGPGMSVIGELRRNFPGLSFTRCDPSDLGGEPPFRSSGRFDLYLVDGSDHCWQLTGEPARATGLVVVEAGGRG